jgi:hypothetical protein
MKRFSICLLLLISALPAVAGWEALPVDVTVSTVAADSTVATTGTVTEISAPASGASWFVSAISVSGMLPADLTATATVSIVQGEVTNEYALAGSNTTSDAVNMLVSSADAITATLNDGATNLPSIVFSSFAFPATSTVLLTGSDNRKLHAARLKTGLLPVSGSVDVSGAYAGTGTTESMATLTNASACVYDSSPLWLTPLDSIVVSVSGATNSPTVRIITEKWVD